jgi:hypothetical protein
MSNANEAPSLEGLMKLVFHYGACRVDVDRSNGSINQRAVNAAIDELRAYAAALTAAPAPANPDEFGVDEYIAPQDAETKSAIRFEEWMYQARELIRDREQAYLAWRNGRDNDPSEVLFDAYQLAKLSLSAHLAKRIAPAPTDAQIEPATFREILDWRMCSDPWPGGDMQTVDAWMDARSRELGYSDWLDAYHTLQKLPPAPSPEGSAVMEVLEAPRYWLHSEDLGGKRLFVLEDDHVRLLRQVASGVNSWPPAGTWEHDCQKSTSLVLIRNGEKCGNCGAADGVHSPEGEKR